jgi:hypothetical protein
MTAAVAHVRVGGRGGSDSGTGDPCASMGSASRFLHCERTAERDQAVARLPPPSVTETGNGDGGRRLQCSRLSYCGAGARAPWAVDVGCGWAAGVGVTALPPALSCARHGMEGGRKLNSLWLLSVCSACSFAWTNMHVVNKQCVYILI